MSEPVSGITEEMVRKAEDAIEDLLQMLGVLPGERPEDGYRDEPYARTIARAAVTAALSGRVPVTLPQPDDVDEYGTVWESPAGRVRIDHEDAQTVWDEDSAMDGADAELHALALLAAAGEARRMAGQVAAPGPRHPAGSPEGHFQPTPQSDQQHDQSSAAVSGLSKGTPKPKGK